jgi:polysaccharide pyruvyl transferase WcaK-like protein
VNIRRPVLRLHGAYEVENFGDILLARIFADWAREAGWEPITIGAPDYVHRDLNLSPDVTDAPRAVLLVGGGYLGEPKRSLPGRWNWGFKLVERHLSVMAEARSKNLPYAVIGAGFGPISNLFARWKAKSLMKGAAAIVLRDPESANWAKQYGVRCDAISADAAVTLSNTPLNAIAQTEAARFRAQAEGRKIVAVQFDRAPSGADEWAVVFDELEKRLHGLDCFVVGISDQRGTAVAEMHRQAAELFLTRFPNGRFEAYDGLDSMLGRLSAADLIITTKLHIGIVGSAYGRAVLSLPTHQKTVRFYRQLERTQVCVPKADWSSASISAAFDQAWALVDKTPLTVPEALTRASRSNAEYVNAFLNKSAG